MKLQKQFRNPTYVQAIPKTDIVLIAQLVIIIMIIIDIIIDFFFKLIHNTITPASYNVNFLIL